MLIFTLASVGCESDSDEAVSWREVIDDLPSGVVISVEISTPDNGDRFPQGATVPVTGFATLGETAPVANTTLAYVIDVSGSTSSDSGCGGNLNGDGLTNSVLDCELASVLALNGVADTIGTIADVGAAVFGETASPVDMRPAGTPLDLLTAPDADLDNDVLLDVEEVTRSVNIGAVNRFTPYVVGSGGTSYGAGLAAIEQVLLASSQPNKVVAFLSDGFNNTGPDIDDILPMPAGTVIHTFAVGAGSACDIDSDLGSLQDIADATNGTCTEVPDVADLPNILPSIITAQLVGLELRVDGAPVPIENMSQMLPQPGAVVVSYSTTIADLAPGPHHVCATAVGSDANGGGFVEECVTIFINRPPVAVCEDVLVTADADCSAETASIDHGSFDPDGDDFTCEVDPPGPYSLGTTNATLTCTDSSGAQSSCQATIEVADETPPTVDVVDAPILLWPPNHDYHDFSVADCIEEVTDNCVDELDEGVALEIVRVTSDETDLAKGSGNTCHDVAITGDSAFRVRAERIGGGDGRVYTAFFTATDSTGNSTFESCEMHVPANMNPNENVVDSDCKLCVGDGCGKCPSNSAKCN
jgi:hypothetical protein